MTTNRVPAYPGPCPVCGRLASAFADPNTGRAIHPSCAVLSGRVWRASLLVPITAQPTTLDPDWQ